MYLCLLLLVCKQIYTASHEDMYLFTQLKILQALILPSFEKFLGFFAN